MATTQLPDSPRINVVGATGSGKTTLAGNLAGALAIPHIEIDALFWGPDWTYGPEELFRQRVSDAVSDQAWVIDGNYSRLGSIIWSRANMVVWLDYPFHTVFWQLWRRSLGRLVTGEELWQGNRESWKQTFLSRDSILVWLFRSYGRKRRQYPPLFEQPDYAHISFVRLRSPKATHAWLSELPVRTDARQG